jgi:hypothetical protein
MDDRTSDARNRPARRRLWGVVLMVLGALLLAFLVFISNDQGSERLMMSLGLAGSAMLSATAQFMLLLGAWMLWKAGRRRPR